MIYYTNTRLVDFILNGQTIADDLAITHVLEGTSVISDPKMKWFVIQLCNEDPATGASIDSVAVEVVAALESPVNNAAVVSPHPQFTWRLGGFEDGVAPVESYQVQISTNQNFSSVVIDDTIQINRYVPYEPLSPGNYWWKVRAVINGTVGAWSETRMLAIVDPAHVYTIPANASAAVIASTLATAKANSPAKINFVAGSYFVSPAADSYLINLYGASDLIIDGNGSTIVIGTPDAGFSYLNNCANITIRGFKVDYDPLPHTVGTVTAVDATNKTFDLELWSGYPRLDDPHMVETDLQGTWGSLMSKTVPGRLKGNVGDYYRTEDAFSSVGANTYRLTLTASFASQIGDFSVGDIYVKVARIRALNGALSSIGITYYDVIGYASPGGYFSGSSCTDVHLLKGGSKIKPNSGRWNSASADGVHCQNFRTGPWVQGCTFQGILDDGVNIYSVPMSVYQQLTATTIRMYNLYTGDLQTNDELCFFDSVSGLPVDYGLVSSVVLTNVSGVYYKDVTLEGALTGTLSCGTSKTNTTVYNLSRAGGGFVIRNNLFADSRRYGIFLKAGSGLVVGNGFNCLSGPAIAAHNAPEWPEGLNCFGVSIISNNIIGCSFSSYLLWQNQGSIELYLRGYTGSSIFESSWRGHKGILIRGNTIKNWNRRAISGRCAQDLLIEGNVITNTVTGFYSGGTNYGIFLNNTDNAMILDNLISDTRAMDGAIEVQNSINTVIQGNIVP
jgi:hypothetical protein